MISDSDNLGFAGEDTVTDTDIDFRLDGHMSDSILLEVESSDLPLACKFTELAEDSHEAKFLNCTTTIADELAETPLDVSEIFEFMRLSSFGNQDVTVSITVELGELGMGEFSFNFGDNDVNDFLLRVFGYVKQLLDGKEISPDKDFLVDVGISPEVSRPAVPAENLSIKIYPAPNENIARILGLTTRKIQSVFQHTHISGEPVEIDGDVPDFITSSSRPRVLIVTTRGGIHRNVTRVVFAPGDSVEDLMWKVMVEVNDLVASSPFPAEWDIDLEFV
jgi:hypothetical protein